MNKKLTQAQAETIKSIYDTWGMTDFTPREAFPGRNNRDNAARRVCLALARRGLFDRVLLDESVAQFTDHIREQGRCFRFRLNQQALDRFFEYAHSVDYDFPWH